MQNMHVSGGLPTGMAHPGKGQPRDGTNGASKHKFGQRATLEGMKPPCPAPLPGDPSPTTTGLVQM